MAASLQPRLLLSRFHSFPVCAILSYRIQEVCVATNCRRLYNLLSNLDSWSDEDYFFAVHWYNTHC